ncbi:Uncharacterised protein [Helicobacter fennelliae]|uniref:Uncharacterized protein n=1 Tax=Helicobacter fennelliae TaxID=215 RepID=A0A2X3DYJ7_9HELI|nr:Uncharacterised protein [Helicobacter fennelliae]
MSRYEAQVNLPLALNKTIRLCSMRFFKICFRSLRNYIERLSNE